MDPSYADAPSTFPRVAVRTTVAPPRGIEVTALYVLSKLEEHTRECARRWQKLFWMMIFGFASLSLALFGIVIALLSHGAVR